MEGRASFPSYIQRTPLATSTFRFSVFTSLIVQRLPKECCACIDIDLSFQLVYRFCLQLSNLSYLTPPCISLLLSFSNCCIVSLPIARNFFRTTRLIQRWSLMNWQDSLRTTSIAHHSQLWLYRGPISNKIVIYVRKW